MLEATKLYVQCAFDVRGGGIHVNEQAIWMAAGEHEMIGFYKSDDGLVIVISWAEFLGELFGCEKLVEIRTGRIIELLEQVSQGLPITQGEPNGQIEAPVVVDLTDRPQAGYCPWDMAVKRAEFSAKA